MGVQDERSAPLTLHRLGGALCCVYGQSSEAHDWREINRGQDYGHECDHGYGHIDQRLYTSGMNMRYLETHPWITFKFDPPHSDFSMRLGEAYSKCQHLGGTPLQPHLAHKLASIYLAKGVNATTAIEGNTLSEDEVMAIFEDDAQLPRSQQYLQQEVENVRDVIQRIHDRANQDESFTLTPAWLKEQNALILDGIECESHVVPGEFTSETLVVGNVYRGAPPADVPHLVDQLCSWVNALIAPGSERDDPVYRFVNTFTAAVLSHLYIAWIHPFGDGNGRTARALECAILAHSGLVPWVSSNLLSNHYNRTRSVYYRRLDAASKRHDVAGFVQYAAEGFVDQLREQISKVQSMQRKVAWINYVHERFASETQGEATKRRRELTLALPEKRFTPRSNIPELTPQLAAMYALREDKTISHDLNALGRLGLLERRGRQGVRPRTELMDNFVPANNSPHRIWTD